MNIQSIGSNSYVKAAQMQNHNEGALKNIKAITEENAKDDRGKFVTESPEQLKLRNSEELKIAQKIKEMAAKEASVVQHERMHLLAGGSSAGTPSYIYELGPDGKRYISGGEVTFYAGGGNPEAVAKSSEKVEKAVALVKDPSNADLHAAAVAAATANSAKSEDLILNTQKKAEDQRLKAKKEEEMQAIGAKSSTEMKEKPMIDIMAAKAMVSAYSNMRFRMHSKFEVSV